MFLGLPDPYPDPWIHIRIRIWTKISQILYIGYVFCPQIRPKVDPESWPLMATDLNPEVPEFVPTFVTSVPQPIKEEEVRFLSCGSTE
jgi:hypothetical protein